VSPANPADEALIQQAYQQLQEGQFEEAVDTFSASLLVEPRQPQALRGRGLAYMQLKQWQPAAADLTRAKEAEPDNPNNSIDLAVCLSMQNEIYPAIGLLESLLARQPQCVRAHIELGFLHIRIGAITKGKSQLQEALKHRPALAERRLIEATLAEQTKQDRQRYYRPDFEALNQQLQDRPRPAWVSWIRKALKLQD